MLATMLALVASLLTGPSPMPYADPLFPRGLPPAASEDSCNGYRCVWDARHQGNGDGQSLILTRYQGGYLMKPIGHRRAHWLEDQYRDR